MDGAKLQTKIYKGYAQAAKRLGLNFNVCRPIGALTPLANIVTSLLAAFDPSANFSFNKGNKYAINTMQALLDGTLVQVGDYLVGDQTYFLISKQPLVPMLAVPCNRVINVLRPPSNDNYGAVGYSGNVPGDEKPLMLSWPASVLQGTKGEKGEVNLPGDVRNPWWSILLPAFAGVTLESSDIITDDLGRRYVISSAELTDLGWRLTAQQAQT